jgi:clan AA aspartic protease (TIGR02281 family)
MKPHSSEAATDTADHSGPRRRLGLAVVDGRLDRTSARRLRIALIAIAVAVVGQPVTAQSDVFGGDQARYARPTPTDERAPPPMQPAMARRIAYTADLAGDPSQSMRIRRDSGGSFVANVLMNGVPVRVIIDTGAQCTILSLQDARQTGADRDVMRSQTMAGIGGYTQLAVTRVRSMNVGGQQLGGFNAVIGQAGIPYTLLGQSEISRLGRIVIEDGVMTISAR